MSAVRELEELAMNAWPAEVIQTVEGWRLRFTQGVSRRANSAWSNQATGATPLLTRIAGAEDFYRTRGVEVCFHVSPLSPEALDRVLSERGYYRNGDTCVQRADLDHVIATTPRVSGVQMLAGPTPEWEGVAWPDPGLRPAVRRAILRRIGPASVCALAHDRDGRAVAAGLGVVERGHLGIFSMRTQQAARGRGWASGLLNSLATWAQQAGARTAYLQVEEDNPSAQRLYARAGFAKLYGYHYRSLASG